MNYVIKILQNWDIISTFIVFLCSAISGSIYWAWKAYKKIKAIYFQLVPNGGSSLADKIERIEFSLLITNMRHQIVCSNLNIAYYECEADGSCSFANQQLCDLFGLSEQQILGNGWYKAIADDERSRVKDNWDNARLQRLPYDQNYDVINQRTKERYLCRATGYTCYNNNKHEPIYYFGTVVKL